MTAQWSAKTREIVARAQKESHSSPSIRFDLLMRLIEVENHLVYMYQHARHLSGWYADCGHGASSTTWCQPCFENWMDQSSKKGVQIKQVPALSPKPLLSTRQGVKFVRGQPHLWVERETRLNEHGWYCLMCEWSHGWNKSNDPTPKPAPGICEARGPLEVRRR